MMATERKKLEDICTGDDLTCEMKHLQELSTRQELEIKDAILDFAHEVNPVTIMKEGIHGLASLRPVTSDPISITTNIGSNYIIEKALGKNRSIKGFITSMVVEAITTELINRKAPEMLNQVLDWGKMVGIDLEDRI